MSTILVLCSVAYTLGIVVGQWAAIASNGGKWQRQGVFAHGAVAAPEGVGSTVFSDLFIVLGVHSRCQ